MFGGCLEWRGGGGIPNSHLFFFHYEIPIRKRHVPAHTPSIQFIEIMAKIRHSTSSTILGSRCLQNESLREELLWVVQCLNIGREMSIKDQAMKVQRQCLFFRWGRVLGDRATPPGKGRTFWKDCRVASQPDTEWLEHQGCRKSSATNQECNGWMIFLFPNPK